MAETELSPRRLVYPLFVRAGDGIRNPVRSMPGIFQLSVDKLLEEVSEVWSLGIPAIMLFGIPEYKDEIGSSAWDPKGPVPQAIRAIKAKFPELVVIADVCLCEYTDHGHCGVPHGGRILNDPSLEFLARAALCYAEAGADIVAPSDMMDGRVQAIRARLDAHGLEHVPIMSYAAKYASSFYGPFREAAGSAPQFGDRRSYQMDSRNASEALREVALDLEEGADIVMVKPAFGYLDVVRQVKDTFKCPVAAYNVSGEYAMVKAASELGYLDGEKVMLEMLTSIRRAGADIILTYFAKEAARLLRGIR